MRNFLIIVCIVGIVFGFDGLVSGEEQRSLLRPPQFEQPKAGSTVDASFKGALEGIPSGANRISIMEEEVTVLIPRDILEYLKIAKPVEAKTEEERMPSLRARRAGILLDNLQNINDELGCSLVSPPLIQTPDILSASY